MKRRLAGGTETPSVGPHRRSSHQPRHRRRHRRCRRRPSRRCQWIRRCRWSALRSIGGTRLCQHFGNRFLRATQGISSERVCGEVGIEGVDGAPAAREAGQPALSPAKLASNFARSAARRDANARLDSLLIFFPSATAEPPASGGRPDLDMALDILFRCYHLTPNPRHTRKDSNYRFLHTQPK